MQVSVKTTAHVVGPEGATIKIQTSDFGAGEGVGIVVNCDDHEGAAVMHRRCDVTLWTSQCLAGYCSKLNSSNNCEVVPVAVIF